MNFGYDDSEINIQHLPEHIENNDDIYNQIDSLRLEPDPIPAIINLLKNAGATYFIITTGGGFTTRFRYEVHTATTIKMKEMLTWVECS